MSRTREILIIIVAIAVILMLWLTGNEPKPYDDPPDEQETAAVAASAPQADPALQASAASEPSLAPSQASQASGAASEADRAAQASQLAQAASVPRGIPRDGTLDPISIDWKRSADELPVYQADGILKDYQDQPEAADKKYRDQYFIVEGVASGIRRDAEHRVFLDIRTDDPTRQVRGILQERQICGPAGRECEVEARATMVRRGQKIAVECNGAGVDNGTPMLVDCMLRGGAN